MSLRLSFVLLLASSVLAEMVIVQTDNWLNYTISGQAPNSTELFAFRDYDYVSPRLPQFDSNQPLNYMSVKVAVRVRPFNEREVGKGSKCCVRMQGKSTGVTDPATGKER